MDKKQLFENALSIASPWYIDRMEFDSEKKRLDIHIDFERGATFRSSDPAYEGEFKAFDTKPKTWRHLNFFQHECYLHCRTPRIKPDSGKIELISPPWEGKHPGFTLLFEALILELCTHMPVNCVSRMINENDGKIWRMLEKYIDIARLNEDFSELDSVGMDETSRAKHHQYVTLFVDLDQNRTIFVTEGKGNETVKEFADDLEAHNGDRNNIKDVSCDMSPAFIKGVNENLPEALITFDKFHILKIINEAVDKVRREEVTSQPLLLRTKYVLLKNDENLTEKEREKLEKLSLPSLNLKSIRALNIRNSFQDIYKAPTEEGFETLLKKWYFWATHSRLDPIIKAAKTIKNHWDGVIEWKRSQINNGVLEGLNSVVQAAKAKARGFRTTKYFK
ncbi:MAG: ISL3 family transposase, partial [Desulfobacteraceae bacterium]|nr:ISL3 family transposase [Desulfobacteraceae bacterium]